MITIKSKVKNYKIIFTKKLDISKKNNVFYIVDDYFSNGKNKILDLPINKTIYVKANEVNKSYNKISNIISKLLNKNIDKASSIVCIGGGTIQDISSFISLILFRGIDWKFIPTTLLSQGDSCIGSKISVNFKSIKNLLGGYWPPSEILLNINFLKFLPKKEIYSGLGEISHYFYLSNLKNFKYFKKSITEFNKNNLINFEEIIKKSLLIKRGFIEKDEYEKKERIFLNYGHTFGHAIESITNFKIPHGVAVSMGMHIANYISFRLNYIKETELSEYQLPLEIIFKNYRNVKLSPTILLKKILQDKKVINKKARIIILKKIGNPMIKKFEDNLDLLTLLKDYFKYRI